MCDGPAGSGAAVKCNPAFVRLTLSNATTDETVATADYWISATPDVLDWGASTFYRTPCSSYVDYNGLCALPAVNVTATIASSREVSGRGGAMTQLTVQVSNHHPQYVAFFVRLRLRSSTATTADVDVLPVLWDDNYITLFGSEQRAVNVSFSPSSLNGGAPVIVVEVFNNVVSCK